MHFWQFLLHHLTTTREERNVSISSETKVVEKLLVKTYMFFALRKNIFIIYIYLGYFICFRVILSSFSHRNAELLYALRFNQTDQGDETEYL